jgi:hypothetical protein
MPALLPFALVRGLPPCSSEAIPDEKVERVGAVRGPALFLFQSVFMERDAVHDTDNNCSYNQNLKNNHIYPLIIWMSSSSVK